VGSESGPRGGMDREPFKGGKSSIGEKNTKKRKKTEEGKEEGGSEGVENLLTRKKMSIMGNQGKKKRDGLWRGASVKKRKPEFAKPKARD